MIITKSKTNVLTIKDLLDRATWVPEDFEDYNQYRQDYETLLRMNFSKPQCPEASADAFAILDEHNEEVIYDPSAAGKAFLLDNVYYRGLRRYEITLGVSSVVIRAWYRRIGEGKYKYKIKDVYWVEPDTRLGTIDLTTGQLSTIKLGPIKEAPNVP